METVNYSSQCIKCGSREAAVTHITGHWVFGIPEDDFIRRACSCGYTWREAPLERTRTLYDCHCLDCQHTYGEHDKVVGDWFYYRACGACKCGMFRPDAEPEIR